jgi:hypothetical protein
MSSRSSSLNLGGTWTCSALVAGLKVPTVLFLVSLQEQALDPPVVGCRNDIPHRLFEMFRFMLELLMEKRCA